MRGAREALVLTREGRVEWDVDVGVGVDVDVGAGEGKGEGEGKGRWDALMELEKVLGEAGV